jgi:hypothetical protein
MAKVGSKNTHDAGLAAQLAVGMSKHFPNATSITFGSATYSPAEVNQRLQTLVNLRTGVTNARSALQAQLAAEKAQAPALQGFVALLVSYVRAIYSQSPDVLADFGLQPKKVAKPATVETKAAAVAKRESTRKARQTMGSVQKQEVTGDVVGVVVTPVTSPKPTAPAAPASSASTGTNPVAPSGAAASGATPHGS